MLEILASNWTWRFLTIKGEPARHDAAIKLTMKNISVILVLAVFVAACNKPNSNVSTPAGTSPAVTRDAAKSRAPQAQQRKYEGPFGLAMGISVADLIEMKFIESKRTTGIFAGTPPKPVEGIESVIVLAGSKSGLCRIRATQDVKTVNGSGDQLKAQVDRTSEMVATKYGAFTDKTDLIGEDVYRRNPRFWMMGLKEDSVAYGYDWAAGKTKLQMPPDLESIEVFASATELSEGYSVIQYTFKNFKECTKEMKESKAANL